MCKYIYVCIIISLPLSKKKSTRTRKEWGKKSEVKERKREKLRSVELRALNDFDWKINSGEKKRVPIAKNQERALEARVRDIQYTLKGSLSLSLARARVYWRARACAWRDNARSLKIFLTHTYFRSWRTRARSRRRGPLNTKKKKYSVYTHVLSLHFSSRHTRTFTLSLARALFLFTHTHTRVSVRAHNTTHALTPTYTRTAYICLSHARTRSHSLSSTHAQTRLLLLLLFLPLSIQSVRDTASVCDYDHDHAHVRKKPKKNTSEP